MFKFFKHIRRHEVFIGLLLFVAGSVSLFNIMYADKILPRIYVGTVDVGGITVEEAVNKLKSHFDTVQEQGVRIVINGEIEIINPRNIDMQVPSYDLALEAWSLGRSGSFQRQMKARVAAPFSLSIIKARVEVDEQKLESEIAMLANLFDIPRQDIRLDIEGAGVNILYDTKIGKILNKTEAKNKILSQLSSLDFSPISLALEDDLPKVNPLRAEEARHEVEKMIREGILLSYKGQNFYIDGERIGSWIVSGYEDDRLVSGLNKKLISEYITEVAEHINTAPQSPRIVAEDGKAVEFTLPKYGRALLQDETIELIENLLENRKLQKETVSELSLPVLIRQPLVGDESSQSLGIVERIGRATTPFTGSPKNRVHNIKNGIRFLTGILIGPGEEFSTAESLGEIDNAAGYLPELVIKGDETIPEFGGGLCQVSTTLFRAVLDAGLPIIERRNHSYRVPYYERDGEGNFIGPGLDATIYSPKPDFRFKNDTASTILIYGYVKGDKATFELYGTSDGRVSQIDGPHTLAEEPPGDPVYIETDTLPEGETKKIDSAHPGGEAVATYAVTYLDGRLEEQEFRSFYRKWPAKYLIGVKKVMEE